MPSNVTITHESLNDNTVEGIRLNNKPVFILLLKYRKIYNSFIYLPIQPVQKVSMWDWWNQQWYFMSGDTFAVADSK